jgi:flavin-dependent dehydrogenase
VRHDVAIIGAGPAGAAAAITLRRRYPGLSVTLFEGTRFDAPRVGEILSPAATGVLEHLGVLDAFNLVGFRPVHGSAVSWGSPMLVESAHLFTFHGPGWHLDRARFDALLAHEAERRGVDLRWGERVSKAPPAARFVIDATGRAASIARAAGARVVADDHLTAFVCLLSSPAGDDPRTVIEAVEDGWWYTGALDGGVRIAAFLTDADIGQELGVAKRERWRECLARTRYLLRMDAPVICGPMVRAANSQHIEPVWGDGWLATGDAALALDPLSGQGIVASLRSGIFAGYAIGDWLTRGDEVAPARYRRFVAGALANYQRTRRQYYGQEGRWPESAFWARRISAS